MKTKLFVSLFVLFVCIANAYAQDWPQFLGPERNSTSREKGILRSWPETGPEVLWTISVGRGYGGPVVKEGKVYLLDRIDSIGDNMRCFDLLTGKVLWQYKNWECHISVANAGEAGNNKLLVVGGYELGCVMIQVEKKADGSYGVNELFKHNDFGDHTKPPILFKDYFYAQFSTNGKRDGLVCMNMDGKIMWKTKNEPKFDKGSMILADGLIIATDGANKLYLIEPDPAGFKPLASADLLKPGGVDNRNRMTNFGGSTQNWAPMALADGKLLIRDQSRLMCVKVSP
jgi:hypothetical protein